MLINLCEFYYSNDQLLKSAVQYATCANGIRTTNTSVLPFARLLAIHQRSALVARTRTTLRAV